MINPDLELRLRPFRSATEKEREFIKFLWEGFVLAIDSEYPIRLSYIEIEGEEYPDDDSAFVDFCDDYFHVVLDPRMPVGMLIDLMTHEMAHVGTWLVNEPEDHGPHFGVEWAKLYRVYLDLYDEFWYEEDHDGE